MCQFCCEFNGNGGDEFERWLFWGDEFVVGPTLGHFAPGYLLLMPVDHSPSFASLDRRDLAAASEYLAYTRYFLADHYGPTIIAEHGPGGICNRGAACCDHAHMHLIPMRGETQAAAVRDAYLARDEQCIEIDTLSDLRRWDDAPYLYLSTTPGEHLVWPLTDRNAHLFPRQFVRRICADLMEVDGWDWRAAPFLDRMLQTRDLLTTFFCNNGGPSPYRPQRVGSIRA